MFNGNTYRDAIISGANNIVNNKSRVDELNVFPVPDGDTGTNMSMTAGSAAAELGRLSNESVEVVTKTAAAAMLRGARGNSGVILSLLFRGISKGMKGVGEASGADFAAALKKGVESAYGAVMKPTEGTILTVARVAQEYAQAAVDAGADDLAVFEETLKGAKEALAETPELLPVLKKAGVVDAGGQGFVVILEGMLSVLRGDGIINLSGADSDQSGTDGEAAAKPEYTYSLELSVERGGAETDPAELRSYLSGIGGGISFDTNGDVITAAVKTDHPGSAIEKALEFGQLSSVKIENLVSAAKRSEEFSKEKTTVSGKQKYTPVAPSKPFGFVVVSAGEGLESLFRDLGADTVVSGGQTMNPSTDDILSAIEGTPGETVFVLPNNKNIIMAAEQAAPLATRKVEVLHSKSIPMGIAAMLSFDPDASTLDNVIAMRDAMAAVGSGAVTFAARDSEYDGHKIRQGDLLALENNKITFVETDLERCVARLVKSLVKRETCSVTLFYGEDITDEQAAAVQAAVETKIGKDIEVVTVSGGQPVYYFIISVD